MINTAAFAIQMQRKFRMQNLYWMTISAICKLNMQLNTKPIAEHEFRETSEMIKSITVPLAFNDVYEIDVVQFVRC